MIDVLPLEIYRHIIDLAGSRINYVLGIPVNDKRLLLEGGPCGILEEILQIDADIQTLINIRPFVPGPVAVMKSVKTQNLKVVKRVCLLWDTWDCDNAISIAWDTGFQWPIEHLQYTISDRRRNQMYFELGMVDKINLECPSPFYDIKIHTCDYIKAHRLSYKPFFDTLNTATLLRLYIVKNDRTKVHSMLKNDLKRELPLEDILIKCLEHSRHQIYCPSFMSTSDANFQFPIDLFQEYEELYDLNGEEIESCLLKQRKIELLEYYKMDMLEVHRAVLNRDANILNECLVSQREETLRVLFENYVLSEGEEQFEEILHNTDIKLDSKGQWLGLTQTTHMVEEEMEVDMRYLEWGTQEEEADLELMGLTTLKEVCENHVDAAYVFKYLQTHGYDELDTIELPLKVSESLGADMSPFYELVRVLISKGYEVSKVDDVLVDSIMIFKEVYECPLIYVHEKTIYYTNPLVKRLYPPRVVQQIARVTDLTISLETYSKERHTRKKLI